MVGAWGRGYEPNQAILALVGTRSAVNPSNAACAVSFGHSALRSHPCANLSSNKVGRVNGITLRDPLPNEKDVRI